MHQYQAFIAESKPYKILIDAGAQSASFHFKTVKPRSISLNQAGALETFYNVATMMDEFLWGYKDDKGIAHIFFVWETSDYSHAMRESLSASKIKFLRVSDRGIIELESKYPITFNPSQYNKLKSIFSTPQNIAADSEESWHVSVVVLENGNGHVVIKQISSNQIQNLHAPALFRQRMRSLEGGIILTTFNDVKSLNLLVSSLGMSYSRMHQSQVEVPFEKLMEIQDKDCFFFEDGLRDKIENMLTLAYSGKFVIVSTPTINAYASLMKYTALFSGGRVDLSRGLGSLVGIVQASKPSSQLKFLSLTEQISKRILEGEVTKEFLEGKMDTLRDSTHDPKDYINLDFIHQMFRKAYQSGASDIHLAAGTFPKFRIRGNLRDISEIQITPETMVQIVNLLLQDKDEYRATLEEKGGVSMPYSLPGVSRFRIQIILQRGTYGASIRIVPFEIPTAKEMNIPPIIIEAAVEAKSGVCIITGPTSSGKSTTSAIMIDEMKKRYSDVFYSLADPIEFVHSHGKSHVYQREIPSDVKNFREGLYDAFRMNPNVLEIQEMRGMESIEALLRFAASGHKTISGFHTESVISTFETLHTLLSDNENANELYSILSSKLIILVSQKLIPGLDNRLVPIFEYLIPDEFCRARIATGNFNELVSYMKTNAQGDKRIATWFDYEIIEAIKNRKISLEVGSRYVKEKELLSKLQIGGVR